MALDVADLLPPEDSVLTVNLHRSRLSLHFSSPRRLHHLEWQTRRGARQGQMEMRRQEAPFETPAISDVVR